MKIFVSHMNAHLRVTSLEEDFKNQVNIHSVDTSWLFSLDITVITTMVSWRKWLWWQGWRMEVGLGSTTWTSTH